MNHFAWKGESLSHRTKIILYIMVCIVGGAAFIFIHPPHKWQSGPEQVPIQASVNRAEVSAQQSVSSHSLPGSLPGSLSGRSASALSGVRTKKEPVGTDTENTRSLFSKQNSSSASTFVRDGAGVSSGDVPVTREDLTRDFEKFLISQGLPTEPLHREIPSPSASGKKDSSPLSKGGTELDPAIMEKLKDDYPVTDACLQENGEVWIRLDSTDIDKAGMDEMMAAAAELHDNSATPVKVVVWAGKRTLAVRTFFGDPIF